MNRLITAITAAAGALLGWALIENTQMLRVSRYETAFRGLPRTVLVSDLHKRQFGRGQRDLIRQIAKLKPESIIITGDLVSRTVTDFAETEQLLRRLCAIAPVIFSEGNHEADLPPSLCREFRQAVARSGALYLHNSYARLGGVTVAGLALPPEYYRGGARLGYLPKRACTAETLHQLLGKCPPETLLLAHNPLYFAAYAEWGAALTLSGHVHGGAVRLPFIGGLLSPERTFLPRYDKGRFRIGAAEMIVSAGLGKLRLFNPPEICLITSAESPKT